MRTAMRQMLTLIVATLALQAVIAQAADYTVTVNSTQTMTPGSMQGFLNGFAGSETLDATLVGTNLRPSLWRLGFGWDKYQKVKALSPMTKVTMVLSDMYVGERGGYSGAAAKPWLNWTDWENFCRDQVRRSKGTLAGFNDGPMSVDYWDIWSEPDIASNWFGTWPQLLETYQRCYNKITGEDSAALVVGPGTTEFDHVFESIAGSTKGLKDFVHELSRDYGVRLQAVSWHEIGSQPSALPGHAQEMRDFVADATKFPFGSGTNFPQPYQPELHINEYGQPNNSQIPGWIVGWLYYAEQASLPSTSKVTWLSRACWPMVDAVPAYSDAEPWSGCEQGLSGLFMRNLITPQQPYFVYKAYAELTTPGSTRLVTTSTNSLVNALASKSDSSSTVRVIVGSHQPTGSPTRSVDVQITNFPYGASAAGVTVRKLTNNNVLSPGQLPQTQAAVHPTVTYAGNVTVSGGSLTVNIPTFVNGEMYAIEAVPSASVAPATAAWTSPASGATNVDNRATLTWTAGTGATSHNVYFGTTNPPPFRQNQSETTFDPAVIPGAMLGTQTFYWRIDEKNSAGVTTGPVWSFTAAPLTHPLYFGFNAGVATGSHVSGSVVNTQSAIDNAYYVVRDNQFPAAWIAFLVNQTRNEVVEFALRIISKDSSVAGSAGMLRSVYLWNYDIGRPERVTWSLASTSPTLLQVHLRGNAGRFVGPDRVVKLYVQDITDFAPTPPQPHDLSIDYAILRINGEIAGAY